MLQAVLKTFANIELEETEERPLKDGEVRLKVISCAICGSDIRIYKNGNPRIKFPHVIGHEVVGQIIEKSKDCLLNIGDYCCFGADLPCDNPYCKFCFNGDFSSCNENYAIGYQFDGGFAETMIIPKNCWQNGSFKIIDLPKHINNIKELEQYSLVEPLSCAWHGVVKMNIDISDNVLIFGGGPIGLMIGDLCLNVKNCNSVTIIEPSTKRIKLIQEKFPEFNVVNNKSELNGNLYDVIFTANSVPACHRYAIDFAAPNARINFFGGLALNELNPINTNKIHYSQLVLTGTHGSRYLDFEDAFNLVQNSKINLKKYITASYQLKDINEAFKAAMDLNNLKIIIRND